MLPQYVDLGFSLIEFCGVAVLCSHETVLSTKSLTHQGARPLKLFLLDLGKLKMLLVSVDYARPTARILPKL
jgi:hypothetical protein